MKKFFKTAVPSLLLAFTLAGCGESPQDIARKPSVADPILKDSVKFVSTAGLAETEKENYSRRLRTVLMNTDTADLEFLKNNKITVCLDKRLSSQKTGFLDTSAIGILYCERDKNTLTLWDDGRLPENTSMWTTDTYDYGSTMLKNLVARIKDSGMPAVGEKLYAGAYTYVIDTTAYTEVEWRNESDFDQATIRKNPALQNPPTNSIVKTNNTVTPKP